MFEFTQSFQLFEGQFPFGLFGIAVLAIILHVANYNATAHLEYNTRIFTKVMNFKNVLTLDFWRNRHLSVCSLPCRERSY